jgi:hypothetical protein
MPKGPRQISALTCRSRKPWTLRPATRPHWNNTAANQPFVGGLQVEPRDVWWGNGSRDEMCLGVLYLTHAGG